MFAAVTISLLFKLLSGVLLFVSLQSDRSLTGYVLPYRYRIALVFVLMLFPFFIPEKFSFILSSFIGAGILGGSAWFLLIQSRLKSASSNFTRHTTKVITVFLGIKIGEYIMLSVSAIADALQSPALLQALQTNAELLLLLHLRFALGVLLPFTLYFLRFNYKHKSALLTSPKMFFWFCFCLALLGEVLSAFLYFNNSVVL